MNNSHLLTDQAMNIDSRNVFAYNSKNSKKNWGSASLNLKKFIKKKDLNMVYPPKKEMKKKSHEGKLTSFKTNSMAISAEQQFKSFLKNEKQFLINPYFPSNTDFSKSFGSDIYKPTSVTSGKKLAALKNCLVTNTYTNNKNIKTKIEKKSIKFAMKNQNLSFNEKTASSMLKNSYDKGDELESKKKRSVSPMTKGLPGKYSTTQPDINMTKTKGRGGSRKTNMRSPGGVRIY